MGTYCSGVLMTYGAHDRSVPVAHARGSAAGEAALGHQYGACRWHMVPTQPLPARRAAEDDSGIARHGASARHAEQRFEIRERPAFGRVQRGKQLRDALLVA